MLSDRISEYHDKIVIMQYMGFMGPYHYGSIFLGTKDITILVGGFRCFFIFTPTWGNDPIRRAYFSNGLKPPTSIS